MSVKLYYCQTCGNLKISNDVPDESCKYCESLDWNLHPISKTKTNPADPDSLIKDLMEQISCLDGRQEKLERWQLDQVKWEDALHEEHLEIYARLKKLEEIFETLPRIQKLKAMHIPSEFHIYKCEECDDCKENGPCIYALSKEVECADSPPKCPFGNAAASWVLCEDGEYQITKNEVIGGTDG